MTDAKSTAPAGFEEVQSNWFKLTAEPGAKCAGVYVGKKTIDNTMKQPACKQNIYTLLQDDGTTINVGGRGGQDPQVLAGLENCKLGQKVIVEHTENIPPKKAGYQAVKVVKVFKETGGKIHQEALNDHNGVAPASAETFTEVKENDLGDIEFGA